MSWFSEIKENSLRRTESEVQTKATDLSRKPFSTRGKCLFDLWQMLLVEDQDVVNLNLVMAGYHEPRAVRRNI